MLIEVIDYEENEDGSANILFDVDEETINLFIMEGLRKLLKDEPVVVMPVEEYMGIKDHIKEPKQVELEPQMAQGLLELGLVEAIKRGIENVSNSDGDG